MPNYTYSTNLLNKKYSIPNKNRNTNTNRD